MRYLMLATFVVLTAAGPAQAQRFFQRYDADELFPEEDGWARYWGDPEGRLVRTLQNGIFRLDTRGSSSIFDTYEVISEAFVLGPEEEFRATWRMETLETDASYGRSDVAFFIINEFHEYAEFYLAPTYVSEHRLIGGTMEHLYEIEAGVAHTYYVVTTDMQVYDLYVDGEFAFQGHLQEYAWRNVPRVAFGDAITGFTSLSEWDFVEISVVPEPSSGVALAAVLPFSLRAARRLIK